MSDVELVIKIPEELYKSYKGRPPMLGDAGMDMISQAIANGTPLPKGHGRLIDADEIPTDVLFDIDEDGNELCFAYERDIENAPTIIEADRDE